MTFEAFYDVFEQWLQNEDDQLRKRFDVSPTKSEKYKMVYSERIRPQREEISHENVFEESYLPSYVSIEQAEPSDKFYEANKKKFSRYWEEQKETINDAFDCRRSPQTSKLAAIDLFQFLQEICYTSMLQIKEMKTDEHDFFQSVNSYKKLLKVMDDFWKSEKNESFSIKTTELELKDVFRFIDFWFKTNPHVYVAFGKDDDEDGTQHAPEYEKNRAILEAFFKENANKIEKVFADHIYFHEKTIPFRECFKFLKESSYENGFIITCGPSNQNSQQFFFEDPDASTKLAKLAKTFLSKVRDQDVSLHRLEEIRFSINDCFQLLDYWAKTDKNLSFNYRERKYLVESLPSFIGDVGMKETLTNSLAHYQSLLSGTSNMKEKRIISQTVRFIQSQLADFENSTKKLQEKQFSLGPPKTIMKREERRTKALSEIYQHYCTVQALAEPSTISLGGFLSLVSDYELAKADEDKKVLH